MAQEEIIFKVGVDTGDSANKVGAIEEQFDILKKTINDTEQEVEELTKQFGKNSQEVENARKKLGNLNASFNELKGAAINVNSTFEQVYGELQPLTTRLGEAEDRLYELALAGKQNTKEYQDLLETVARYRQTQIETDRIVDQAAMTMTQKLGAAIQVAANGFMVVQGASALFGDESKELEKALLKVQAAMALAQGIEGVRQALPLFVNFGNAIKTQVVTAFTSLKGAIMATGIGALIVTVGVMINEWMEYSKSVEDAENAQQKLNEENKESLDLINDIADASEKKRNREKGGLNQLKNEIDLMKAKGATEKDIFNKSKQIIDEEIKNLQIRGFSYDQSNEKERLAAWETKDQIDKLKNEKLVIEAEYYKKKDDKQKEANKKARERRKQDLEDIRQNKIKQQEIENQRISEQETLENEYYDSFKTQQQLEEQAVRDKYNKIIETTIDNETLKLARQKELDAIANKYKDAADKEESDRLSNIDKQYEEYYNEYYDATTAAYQKEQDAVNAKYFYLIDKAKEYGLSTVELEKKRVEELDKIQTPQKQALQDFKNLYGELSTAIQTSTEIDLNNLKTKHSGELEMLKDNYGEKQNYAELEYGLKMRQYNEEKAIIDRQRAFAEFQKKLAIVQTTIDTAKSLSSTIAGATAAAAAGGPAAPFLLASYIATGIATVTSAYTKVRTLLNSPMPSISAPKMPREMKDGGTGDGTQGTQQTIQAQSTYKVVVVDSDITKMQDKTKKVNAISTI